MKIHVDEDSTCAEDEVYIRLHHVDKAIQQWLDALEEDALFFYGYDEDMRIHPLIYRDILYIYSEQKKVYAKTKQHTWILNERLYVLEERLQPYHFVRVSHSEIVNLHKVQCFDMHFINTIQIVMEDQHCAYVSRRYLPKIRKQLAERKSV